MVRATAAWCLSCYARWVADMEEENHDGSVGPPGSFLGPLVGALLQLSQDAASKQAQRSACKALHTVCEAAQDGMVPFAPAFAAAFVAGLGFYTARNRAYLYDAVAALFESIGTEAKAPTIGGVIMPPLLERYRVLSDTDPELPQVRDWAAEATVEGLESLSPPPFFAQVLAVLTAATTALDTQLAEVASHLCTRAVRLIEHDMVLGLAAAEEARASGADASAQSHVAWTLDKTLTGASLDLLGGLAEAFGDSFDELVGRAGPTLPEMLFECARRGPPYVRQSAFALLGDMAHTSFARFAEALGPVIVACTASMKDPVHSGDLCNNAVWALGQVLLAAGPERAAAAAPALGLAVPRLIGLMKKADKVPEIVRINTAVTLGRLGLVAPAALSAGLGECVAEWASAAVRVREETERRHTYEGMCQAINANPPAAAPAAGNLLVAFVVYEDASPACVAAMRALLLQLKGILGPAAWAALLGRGSPQLRAKVGERFGRDVVG